MKEHGDDKISLGVATIIGMNAMIGAGIVGLPSILAGNVGPAGVLSYAITIGIAILIGLSLSFLAGLHPGSGWSYLYPSMWGGHILGMFSASCYLIGVLIAMGFIAQQSGIWLQKFFPVVDPRILAIIVLVLLTILVLAGAEASSWGQYIIAALVVGPLLLTAIFCWFHFKPELARNFMPYGFMPVLAQAPKVLYTLMGFESIASLYTIVRSPKKNVPKACVLAILSVGSLYMIFAGGALLAIPASFFAKGVSESLASVLSRAFPTTPYLSGIILVGGLFAIVGTLHSMIWSLSSLFTDVLQHAKSSFVKKTVLGKFWSNKVSVFITSGTMLLTSLYIHAESILYLTVCFIAISYVLSITLLLFEKKQWRSGRNIITLLGVLGGCMMFYYACVGVLERL